MSDSSEIVQRIQESSQHLRSAATELTNRITWYEKWLGNLPGRVATRVSMGGDPNDTTEQYLELAREGKEWSLYVYEYDMRTDQVTGRTLLRDASIAIKALSIQYFRSLLDNIHLEQKLLLSVSENANKTFDEFVKSLPQKEGK